MADPSVGRFTIDTIATFFPGRRFYCSASSISPVVGVSTPHRGLWPMAFLALDQQESGVGPKPTPPKVPPQTVSLRLLKLMFQLLCELIFMGARASEVSSDRKDLRPICIYPIDMYIYNLSLSL